MAFGIGGASLGEAVLDLRADDSGLERDLDAAKSKTVGILGGITSLAGGILTAGVVGIAGAIAGAVGGVGLSLGSAMKSEEAVAQLDAVLKSTASSVASFGATQETAAAHTAASAKELANWKDQLAQAQDKLPLLNEKLALQGDRVAQLTQKYGANSLQVRSAQISYQELQARLTDTQDKITTLTNQIASGSEKVTSSVAKIQPVSQMSRQALLDLASGLQNVTRYSDEDVVSVESLLLTFTKVGKDIFPQATETVLDMATALGEDTKSAAIQLGKALQDPVQGATALRRVGVNFTKDQIEMFKSLVNTGQAAKAQSLILKELQTEFGGSARAAGKTFAGQLDILNNKFDDVKEKIGFAVLPTLTTLLTMLTTWLDSPDVQQGIDRVTTWLGTNLPLAATFIQTNVIPTVSLFIDLLFGLFNAIRTGDGAGWLDWTEDAFGPQVGSMIENSAEAVHAVLNWLSALWGELSRGEWASAWQTIVNGAQNLWNMLSPELAKLTTQFWDWLTNPQTGAVGQAEKKFQDFAAGIGTFLTENGPKAWAQLNAWGDEIWYWLVGKDGKSGALAAAGGKVVDFATALGGELDKAWTSTIGPALDRWKNQAWEWLVGKDGKSGALGEAETQLVKLTDAIDKWANSKEAQTEVENAMDTLGKMLMDALGSFFDSKQSDSPAKNAILKLLAALGRAGASLNDAFAAIGADIGEHVFEGFYTWATGKTATEKMKQAVLDWIKAAVKAITFHDYSDLYGTLFQNLGANNAPVVPLTHGLTASGLIGSPGTLSGAAGVSMVPVHLTVQVGGQEIQDAVATWSYGATSDAVNQAITDVQGGGGK